MNHKILVVDDDPAFISLVKEAFRMEPYKLLAAFSALEAMELLAKEPVDIVLSDDIMPGMCGSEFLAIVRRLYPKTVRIMLTGYASLEAAIRSINEGEIYRFLRKPCNIFDLAITIRTALRKKEQIKENQMMIQMARKKCESLESLERGYPGITTIRKGGRNEILLNEETGELKILMDECRASLGKA